VRTSIYIRDTDQELFEWAKKEAGDSLSAIFADALREYKRSKDKEAELEEEGFEKIVVEVTNPHTGYSSKKQFEGRWVIMEFQSSEVDQGITHSAAYTKHGRIVVLQDDKHGTTEQFDVYDTITQLDQSDYPKDFVSAVANELGEEHVEVLDI